jgi:porin
MDDIDPIAPHRLADDRQPQHGAAQNDRRAACRAGRLSFMARAARPLAMAALVLTAASVSRIASAQDVPAETITGDWGGLRSRLRDRGIDLSLSYTAEPAYNATGGDRNALRYTDQWAFGAALNLERLIGWHDASFQITITDRNGRNLSSDAHLGTLQQVQEVFGRGQTWRLTQFWYDQKYFDRTLDWKIGRLTVGEDFAAFGCSFENLTFCGAQPGNIVGNYWFNWPVSQWATRLKYAIAGAGYVQIGAYQINPAYALQHDAVLPDNPSGTTGALLPLEFAWQPSFGPAALPGSYKLGFWYDTSKASDVFEDELRQPQILTGRPFLGRDGRYGAYVNFQQQLTRLSAGAPARGLSVFLNATQADRRTSTTDNQIAAGLFYTGPFDARPLDEIGFAVGRTHVNDRVADAERLQNAAGLGPVPVQGSEYVAELYYGLHAFSGLVLRPNLQFVHDPGGASQNKDALVLGLKAAATF